MVAWTDTTERQLLLSVIQSASLSKINWDQVALLMGDGYTASGVMQKFHKIKKATDKDAAEVGDVAKGSAPKGKAKGGAAANETVKKSVGKRKGREEDDDEEVDGESPKKKGKVKAEAEARDDTEAEVEDFF